MSTDVHVGNEPSLTSLVTGIINDTQDLFKQQIALLKAELRDDFKKTKEGLSALALGAGLVFFGGLMLCVTLALLLSWAASLPTWAGFGIVGVILTLVGGGLLWAGKKRFDTFNPLPDQTAASVKENVQWMLNQK